MNTKNLTLTEFADLLKLETQRGIINGEDIIKMIINHRMPKIIHDIRGAVRLSIEKTGELIEVTEHSTELSLETIGEIY